MKILVREDANIGGSRSEMREIRENKTGQFEDNNRSNSNTDVGSIKETTLNIQIKILSIGS